jgi:hypothetical protein
MNPEFAVAVGHYVRLKENFSCLEAWNESSSKGTSAIKQKVTLAEFTAALRSQYPASFGEIHLEPPSTKFGEEKRCDPRRCAIL